MINSARKRAILRNNTHPWAKMNDEELLKSAGLYGIDYKNNIEGYNLACILLFGKDEIYTENANKPHGFGLIDPNNFSPYPKNPIIAKMFKEIGLVDELGSGVRNIYKYSKKYFGSEPKLLEDGIFKIIFKVDKFNTQVTTQVTTQVELTQNQILVLKFCNVPRKREEIQAHLNMSNREHFRKSIISPLLEYGFLNMTIPDKPKSSKQKYKISEEGYKFISNFT